MEVHARDVMEHLHHVSAHGVGAFEWTRQLRLYWSRDVNECMVKQACEVQSGSSSSRLLCSLPLAAPQLAHACRRPLPSHTATNIRVTMGAWSSHRSQTGATWRSAVHCALARQAVSWGRLAQACPAAHTKCGVSFCLHVHHDATCLL